MSGRGEVGVTRGDITRLAADAIVNAANTRLLPGGGVCGAIFRAADTEQLGEACRAIGHCPSGSAVATPAFGIATTKWIIHAVGPVYGDHVPDEARRLLRSAYTAAIGEAVRLGCTSIAFPAISTGIYGYPLEAACREAADVCLALAEKHGLRITLVAFDERTAGLLERALEQRRSPQPG